MIIGRGQVLFCVCLEFIGARRFGEAAKDAGHVVVEAEDGMTALERYFMEKPEVVLLDITMKGMNGIEVLTKLREMDSAARVVIATADRHGATGPRW